MTEASPASYILTFTAQDRTGIVAAVSGLLAGMDGFILDSQQYADLESGRFFMRVEFQGAGDAFPTSVDALRTAFMPVGDAFGLDWELVPSTQRMKIVIAVSKGSHCLNDLLHRWSTGSLSVDVAAVVSSTLR